MQAGTAFYNVWARLSCRLTHLLILIWRYSDMKWETPKAVDVRFGFEITLYCVSR